MTRKHIVNESIEIGEKLPSLCFKSLGMAHELHKACTFLAMPTYKSTAEQACHAY